MNRAKLREELVRYEGYRETVYLDTLGLPTVGIGHMDRSMKKGDVYSAETIEQMYEEDVAHAIKIAERACDLYSLDDTRQRVMVQLAFNLGTRLLDFKRTLGAIAVKDWDRAALELQNSKWFTQVGRRGPETCFALRNGFYGWQK